MRAHLFGLLALLVALASPVLGQYFVQAVFHSDGPFTARCDGSGGLLSDETVVFIYHDWDRDGPDSTDTVIARVAPEEYPIAGFYSFFLNQDGSFTSDVWWCFTGSGSQFQDIALYLRIFFGDSLDSCYTSPAMTLANDPATYIITLPIGDWTCGPAPVTAPSCAMGPSYGTQLVSSDPDRRQVCIETCPGGYTALIIVVDENRSTFRPPVAVVSAGCDSNCRPDSSMYYRPGAWWCGFSGGIWMVDVHALHRGCATLTLLDSIPCGTLDTMTAESQLSGIVLRWNTHRETNLDSFELWRQSWHLVTAIPASSAPNGAEYNFLDTTVAPEGDYPYSLVMVASDGRQYGAAITDIRRRLSAMGGQQDPVSGFALHPNYPNPFNPSTTITFDLPVTTRASVRVYDIAGREVSVLTDEVFSAGTHTLAFDGGRLPSGIYIYRLSAGQFTAAQKMILIK